MELQEIYKKFREIVEELNEKDKIRVTHIRFDWIVMLDNTAILNDMNIDTSKRG